MFWATSAEDNVALYEANQETSYALVRAGKYVKFTEDRLGEFATGIISNLLLLGHARVGDLAQAYKVARANDTKGKVEAAHGFPASATAEEAETKAENEGQSRNLTLETLHLTLCNLLQTGLVQPVHETHFRSPADNRSEAEKEIPNPKAYMSKVRKDSEVEWKCSIYQKLDDWKHGTKGEREEIASLQRGKKRLLEDAESKPDFKRLRLYLPLTKVVIGTTGYEHPSKLSETGYLDVC